MYTEILCFKCKRAVWLGFTRQRSALSLFKNNNKKKKHKVTKTAKTRGTNFNLKCRYVYA